MDHRTSRRGPKYPRITINDYYYVVGGKKVLPVAADLEDESDSEEYETNAEWENRDSLCKIKLFDQNSKLTRVDLKLEGSSFEDLFLNDPEKTGNFLHFIARSHCEDDDLLLAVLQWTSANFGQKVLKKMLRTTVKGENVLKLVFRHQKPKVFAKFWKWLIKELQKPLEDFKVANFSHLTISFKATPTISEDLEETPNFQELVETIDQSDSKLIADLLELNELDLIFFRKIVRGMKEVNLIMIKAHFKRINDEDKTIFFEMSWIHNTLAFTRLLSWLQLHFSSALVYLILWRPNRSGKHLMDNLKSSNLKKYKEVLKWQRKNRKQNNWDKIVAELNDYLESDDQECPNTERMILNCKSGDNFLDILEILFMIFPKEKITRILLMAVNNDQPPAVDRSIMSLILTNKDIPLRTFLDFILLKFTEDELKTLFSHRYEKGRTIIFDLCEIATINQLSKFISFLKAVLGDDFTYEAICTLDEDNSNCLHNLTSYNWWISIADFLTLIEDLFDAELVKKLVLKKDNHNLTFLHDINERANSATLIQTLNYISTHTGPKDLLNILKTEDHNEITVIEYIQAKWQNLGIVREIRNLMRELEIRISFTVETVEDGDI